MKRCMLIMLLILLVGSYSALAADQSSKQVKLDLGTIRITEPTLSETENTVIIKDFSFQPAILSVPVGTKVTWHNQDSVGHTVISEDQGLFESRVLASGDKYTFQFNNAGSYKYHCSIHPSMKGEIVVTAATMLSKSMVMKLIVPASTGQGADQGVDQGSVQEASGSNRLASWSEEPISDQMKSKGTTIQQTALQMNPAQKVGQGSGQNAGQSQVMQYSQYYRSTTETPKETLTAPVKYELTGQEPATLYFGASQTAVPYSQYQSYALNAGSNSLWVQGSQAWSQYVMVPQGSSLSMVATSSSGGYGYLYEVYPDGTLDKNSYYFYPYNQVGFYADQVGQHLLFFNIDGQPSNIIVIDVVQYQPQPTPIYDYAYVTISSNWLHGYNVYLDGIYQATEGMSGEPEGVVTISVPGDQYHTIGVQGSGFSFSDYRYFNSGWAYTLNV